MMKEKIAEWVARLKQSLGFGDSVEVDVVVTDTTGDSTDYFEMYKSGNRQWRWRLKAPNHEIIATSGESFSSKTKCRDSLNRVKARAADAKIIEVK